MSKYLLIVTLFLLNSCGYGGDKNSYVMNGPSERCFEKIPFDTGNCQNLKIYNKLKINILSGTNTVNYLISPHRLSEKNTLFGTFDNCTVINSSNFSCDEMEIKDGIVTKNEIIPGLKIKKMTSIERFRLMNIIGAKKKSFPDFEILKTISFADNERGKKFKDKDKSTNILFRKLNSTEEIGPDYILVYRTNLPEISYIEKTAVKEETTWNIDNKDDEEDKRTATLSKNGYQISEDKKTIIMLRTVKHKKKKHYHFKSGGWTIIPSDPNGKFDISIFSYKKNTATDKEKKVKLLQSFNFYVHNCGDTEPDPVSDFGGYQYVSEILKGKTFKNLEGKYCLD